MEGEGKGREVKGKKKGGKERERKGKGDGSGVTNLHSIMQQQLHNEPGSTKKKIMQLAFFYEKTSKKKSMIPRKTHKLIFATFVVFRILKNSLFLISCTKHNTKHNKQLRQVICCLPAATSSSEDRKRKQLGALSEEPAPKHLHRLSSFPALFNFPCNSLIHR
jgi:hypothetical protein